jgi:hypothetical protein
MNDEWREYVIEGIDDDWIYFAEFLSMAQEIEGATDAVPQQALDAAVFFVREGLIMPGDISSAAGFTPWPGGPDEWVDRLRREMGEMMEQGVEPNIGDICWFDFAEEDRRLARSQRPGMRR